VEPWELASIAGELERLMPDTCDVYRRSDTGDAYGGGGDFGSPHVEGVSVSVEPVAVGPFSGGVGPSGRELAEEVQFEIAFPLGTDVADGDMIEVTTMGDVQIVVRMVEAHESWDVMLKAQGTLAQ
jgi:hypothetical protein